MEKPRAFKRIKKTLFALYRVLDSKTTVFATGIVKDISEGGVLLSMDKEEPVGTALFLKIKTFLQCEPIEVTGKIVNLKKEVSETSYLTSISFIRLREETRLQLKKLIEALLSEK